MGHVMHFYESQMQSLALMYWYFFHSFSLAIKLDTILSVVILTKAFKMLLGSKGSLFSGVTQRCEMILSTFLSLCMFLYVMGIWLDLRSFK